MIPDIFLLMTSLSWIYWLVAAAWTRTFFTSNPPEHLDFLPPLSILKPVKGVDQQAFRNFASFCQQDYPRSEILFGVADPQDPAVAVIKRLQAQFPHHSIRLLVGQEFGTNQKASLLHTLAGQARYAHLVISDSDMRVTPDYLRRVVAPLANPNVGLVTCPYRGEQPKTFTARLEALYMGVTFLPSVILGRKFLDMRFAMGATIALRQVDLQRMGGFLAIADYLADDYQIGAQIANLGLRVVLSEYVVTCILGATTFREQWQRELRWSHCTRISRPLEYPGLVLSFSTPLALGYLVASGFRELGWLVLGFSIIERYAVAWLISGWTGDQASRRWLVWLPVRDCLSAMVYLAGLVGRKVEWRGETFRLSSDGKLLPLHPPRLVSPKELPIRFYARLVPTIDGILRSHYGIFEFNQDERCLLRLSLGDCEQDITLADGTLIEAGELVGELHFWNEHIPAMPLHGPDLAWAMAFQHKAGYSLRALADFIAAAPEFAQVRAFYGEPPVGIRLVENQMIELLKRWGFEVIEQPPAQSVRGRFYQFWDTFYAWGLRLAYNPASTYGKRLPELRRNQIWITRQTLLKEYLTPKPLDEIGNQKEPVLLTGVHVVDEIPGGDQQV